MTLSLVDIEAEIKRRHIEKWYLSDIISNYSDAFIIAGYCCLDADTYLFTKRGLVEYANIVVGDEIFSIDENTQEMVVNTVNKILIYPYDSELWVTGSNKSTQIPELHITPNHKVLRYTKEGDKLVYEDAENSFNHSGTTRIPLFPKSWHGNIPELKTSMWINQQELKNNMTRHNKNIYELPENIPLEPFIKLAAWYVTEGTMNKEHGLTIWQSFTKNKPKVDEIIQIIRDLGLTPRPNPKGDSISVSCIALANIFLKEFGKLSHYKRLPRWLLDLDAKYLRMFFDTCIKGDGFKTKDSNVWHLATVSDKLFEGYSEIALKLGYSVATTPFTWGRSRKNLKILTMCHNGGEIKENRRHKEHYCGNVWCVETSKTPHNFLAFSRGKFFFTGNSVSITDREGHNITIPALKEAVAKFMKNPKYRDLNIFHCIFGNTLIDTTRGMLPIKDIVVGDTVATHMGRYKPVIKTFKHNINGKIIQLILDRGEIINITDEHPLLLTSGEWKAAGKLKVGDVLETQDLWSFKMPVKEINIVDYCGDVYNLEVADDNSYCGKYIIYHNSDVQIGEILPYWIHPTTGKVYRTQVDQNGWFVVCKLRSDIEIAKKVREEVEKGNIRSFSIAGTAKNKTSNYNSISPHEDINELEIYEVTCVLENTKIQTLGGEKEIKDITLQDFVLTHNMRFMPVTKLFKHKINGALYEIPFNNGSVLNITPNHPILTTQDNKQIWVRADELTRSMLVNCFNGIWDGCKTTSIEKLILHNYDGCVYNIEVKDDSSYIADNIVVHNCCIEGVNQLARFQVIYKDK